MILYSTRKTRVVPCSLLLVFMASAFVIPYRVFAENFSIPVTPKSVSFSWDTGSETVPPETVSSWFQAENSLQFKGGEKTEAISPSFCPWILSFCDFSLTENVRYSIQSRVSFVMNEALVKDFFEHLQEKTRKNPTDATFSINNDGIVSAFAPSSDGTEMDTESARRILKDTFASSPGQDLSIPLPFTVIRPNVTSTDADRLGITKFLGEGRTGFAGSPKNRIFNIKRAIEQFQGVLIAPGEEFSFVRRLGEVDGEHGYLPELVIKRDRTEPEFGGGICQVSTTLFRAALNTGQKITERRNHAYPVSYYKPYGMDATVYVPKPDFKFVNNTPAHILLQVAIEGSELVFRLYGTPDGRSVSIDGPHITARTPDGGMKTVFTQTVTAADGSVFINDSFRSSYDSPSKYPHPVIEQNPVSKTKN